ncbi:MAG TPA: hypothetical protein EYM96_11020 [Rhodospirillales bacterium]|nr:hypothetical protein [Rhodospirillales bacterium]
MVAILNYTKLNARQIVDGITKGDFTSFEVAKALIEQAKAWEAINSLVNFDVDRFLSLAEEADQTQKEGGAIGKLHGLPLLVKDNIDVLNFPTTAATPALGNYVPNKQGPVINTLLNAGAIVMTKTNMHELAFSPGITEPPDGSEIRWGAQGAAKNPHNLEYSPSGSSSGTGAAISAGISPAGLGSDTGGSVRNPSAWCGITGLRPSTKRYSQVGVVPLSWTRDTIGPMARSVGDLALLDSVITGEGSIHAAEIGELRLGIDRDFFCTDCDPDVLNIFETEVERLSDAGAEIVDLTIQNLEKNINQIGQTLTMYEVVRGLAEYLKASGSGVRFEDLIAQVTASGMGERLKQLMEEEAVSEDVYTHAITTIRPAIQQSYANVFSENNIQALLFPATLLQPNKISELGTSTIRGKKTSYLLVSSHNVQPASIGGSPGLTVAASLTGSGLPAAIGFDGPIGSDRDLLAIGMAYEKIRPIMPSPVLAV